VPPLLDVCSLLRRERFAELLLRFFAVLLRDAVFARRVLLLFAPAERFGLERAFERVELAFERLDFAFVRRAEAALVRPPAFVRLFERDAALLLRARPPALAVLLRDFAAARRLRARPAPDFLAVLAPPGSIMSLCVDVSAPN